MLMHLAIMHSPINFDAVRQIQTHSMKNVPLSITKTRHMRRDVLLV